MGKDENQIKIAKAKGRPMLTWVGKRPLTTVRAYPAQQVESFSAVVDPGKPPQGEEGQGEGDAWQDWPDKFPRGGLLFHGDNKDVLAYLLANGFRGKVKLIYIDPPFDSGADYVRKVQLRGAKGTTKIDGEEYTLGEQIQYTDIWANDNYLQFMYERLLLMKELLAESGSIFVHANHEKVHLLRCVLDEVFGAENFRNDIIWRRGPGKSHPKYFGRVKDTILFYTKSDSYTWNKQYKELSEAYKRTFTRSDERGPYVTQPLHSGKPAKNVPVWKGVKPPEGRGWAYKIETLDAFDNEGRVEWSSDGVPRLKRYLNDIEGAAIQDVWEDIVDAVSPDLLQSFIDYLSELPPAEFSDLWVDISPVLDRSNLHTGYPTQKPRELIERMIKACSEVGDLVLDCFSGSGGTAESSQILGRRWIGCDINKGAIQTTAKRLQTLMREQAAALDKDKQAKLVEDENAAPPPAQLCFNTYRVNDYDLQIQHNEAVELACEHIGITRTRADGYFDGTLGKRLVKIIPLNHPLTPMDLEDLRQELHRRPEEERDITLVSLGMELAARAWIEDYNRARPINKLHVIELRTDKKYGGFMTHEPLSASIQVKRQKDRLSVRVTDVFSPSILQRLNMEQGVFRAQIDDWRAVVDCILIDTDYDGEVFNIALSDIPARKQDQVEGAYELPAPRKGARVAVKVIDMLGEEVIITEQA